MFSFYDFIEYTTQEASLWRWGGEQLAGFFVLDSSLTQGAEVWGGRNLRS